MPLTAVKVGQDGLLAATVRVLDRDGVAGLTLRAVGTEAGVSAPAVYWHFKDKDSLVIRVQEELASDFVTRMKAAVGSAAPQKGISAVGDAVIEYVIEHPHRFQLLFRVPPRKASHVLRKTPPPNSTFGALVEIVKQEMKSGFLTVENPASVALTITALLQGLVTLLERDRFTDRKEFGEFARASFGRLLRGLMT